MKKPDKKIDPVDEELIRKGKDVIKDFDETKEITVAPRLNKWHWPYIRTNSNGTKEYECPHGIGHGDIHGCDGCCASPSFSKKLKHLEGLKQQLIRLGVNVESPYREIASDWATQVLVKGPFAGHSIRQLVDYYCNETNKTYKIVRVEQGL